MKFRVSGTPIAAALLRLIELDPKRGRVFLERHRFRFVRIGHAQSIFSVNTGVVLSGACGTDPTLEP